jgi:PKD repeat protein
MKRTTMKALLLTLFVGVWLISFGQQAEKVKHTTHPCFSDELIRQLEESTPEAKAQHDYRDELITKAVRERIKQKNSGTLKSGAPDITIPVVVYVVHENGVENISDQQVYSQIQILNQYYDSYGIQFCLAKKEGNTLFSSFTVPAGISTTTQGIFHYENSTLTNHNVSQQANLMAVSTLQSARYLRIFVVKKITSNSLPAGSKINGYSMLPGTGAPALDGIVMAYDAFGEINECYCTTLDPLSQNGKILVHEVGHYLGLYHTFQGGCSNMNNPLCEQTGDKVCDTPPVAVPNSGCPVSANSCNETPNLPDDIHNYMDYVNETCMTGFTPGQVDRMIAAIGMYRSTLVSNDNLFYTGISCTYNLTANFTMDNTSPCVGSVVTFTGTSVAGATYDWDFGDGATGTGNPVTHTYSSAYLPATVVMTAHHPTINSDVSTVQTLFVSNCLPIQSGEAQWVFGDRQALSFSTGAPVYSNAPFAANTIPANESMVTQSDASGNLLFYTDGGSLWNGNHVLVTNAIGGGVSSASGAISVPNPANPNQYYLFQTLTYGWANYRIITNTGGGTVSVGPLQSPPIAPVTGAIHTTGEGVTAIASCGSNYWILMKGQRTNGWSLMVFNLTASGLTYHSEHTLQTTTPYTSLEASPNGRKVALGSWEGVTNLVVLDFDPLTGMLSNEVVLSTGAQTYKPWPYGLSFSNNSKLLYSYLEGNSNPIYQYNLQDANPTATARTVGVVQSLSGQNRTTIQRGPDNKLYVIRSGFGRLAVIHEPDNLCTDILPNACNFSNQGPVVLNTLPSQSLPNMVDAKTATVFPNTVQYDVQGCLAYHFMPSVCTQTYSWNFGDPASGGANSSALQAPWHTFSGPGTYTVTLTAGSTVITTVVQVSFTFDITGPETVCLPNGLTNHSLSLAPGQTVTWSVTGGAIAGLNNQTNVDVIWTTLPGTVTAQVYDANTGCNVTKSVTVNNCEEACPCTLKPTLTYSIDGKSCTFFFKGKSGGKSCLKDVVYFWEFGDGTVYIGQNPEHIFPVNGTFTVCLTVYASNGKTTCSKKICKEITVDCKKATCDCKLKPDFKETMDTKTCIMHFEGMTGGPECLENVTYFWEFGDGTTSIGQTPVHTYTDAGEYEVCLTVKASNGAEYCEDKICKIVRVDCKGSCDCKLEPNFKISGGNCNLTFTGTSGSPCANILAYNWYINGMGPVTGQNFTYSFNVNTEYEICFETVAMTDKGECKEKHCENFFFTDCYPDLNVKSMQQQAVELYPNPTTGAFQIGIEVLQQGSVTVSMKTLDGKELFTGSWSLDAGKQVIDLEVPAHVANGLVLVEINAGGIKTIQKVVVTNR